MFSDWCAITMIPQSETRKEDYPISLSVMRTNTSFKTSQKKTNPCFRYEGKTGEVRNLVIFFRYLYK